MNNKLIKKEIRGNETKSLKYPINQHQNRNYGIDLLKIISMINIINLHINNHTRHLRLNPKHPKYKQVYRLEAFSFWPVNAFGLISGIIGYKRYKFLNILYIWFEYLFYSTILSLYLFCINLTSKKDLFLSFFPLGIYRHWYVNAYFFMYLFLPFIANQINSMNKNLYTKMVLFYFFFYSIYHTIIKYYLRKTNYDYINNGYSSLWLLVLYIVGGYIGRFYIQKCFLQNIIFLCIYFITSFISSEYIFYSFKKYKFSNKIFLEYYSPTIIIQAISLIFFFSNLTIKKQFFIKIILFFNPLNFNVTLIHERVFYFQIPIILNLYKYIKSLDAKYLFFKIYGVSVIIYFICAFIDYFRFLLFKILRIKDLCNYIEKKLF